LNGADMLAQIDENNQQSQQIADVGDKHKWSETVESAKDI